MPKRQEIISAGGAPKCSVAEVLEAAKRGSDFENPNQFISPSLYKHIPWIESVAQEKTGFRELTYKGSVHREPDVDEPGLHEPGLQEHDSDEPVFDELGLEERRSRQPEQLHLISKTVPLQLSEIEINAAMPAEITTAENVGDTPEKLAELIHDMRNMVATIDLYCDLLEVQGVLNPPFRHYSGELRMVGASSQRLLEKMALLDTSFPRGISELEKCLTGTKSQTAAQLSNLAGTRASGRESNQKGKQFEIDSSCRGRLLSLVPDPSPEMSSPLRISPASKGNRQVRDRKKIAADLCTEGFRDQSGRQDSDQLEPSDSATQSHDHNFELDHQVCDLGDLLRSSAPLISALAGPGITVDLSIEAGNSLVRMSPEDLTRILVNLTRNALQAMPTGGHIQINLSRQQTEDKDHLFLSFADDGVGIPGDTLEAIFVAGYSTQGDCKSSRSHEGDRDCDGPVVQAKELFGSSRNQGWSGASPSVPRFGRGLGLSIVRSIVVRAGGKVWATNRNDPTTPPFSVGEDAELHRRWTLQMAREAAQFASHTKSRVRTAEPGAEEAAKSSKGAIFVIYLPMVRVSGHLLKDNPSK